MSDHANGHVFSNRALRWVDRRLPLPSLLYHSTSG